MDHFKVTVLPVGDAYEPQRYQIKVSPTLNKKRPDLDFLHKGDGIVLADGVTYIIQFAKQEYVQPGGRLVFGDGHWIWVYTATAVPTDEEG